MYITHNTPIDPTEFDSENIGEWLHTFVVDCAEYEHGFSVYVVD